MDKLIHPFDAEVLLCTEGGLRAEIMPDCTFTFEGNRYRQTTAVAPSTEQGKRKLEAMIGGAAWLKTWTGQI